MLDLVRGVVDVFRASGVVWGGELLLEPTLAAEFCLALGERGVVVLGCDLWRRVDEKDQFVALLGAGFDHPPQLRQTSTPPQMARLVADFIQEHRPSDAEFVSLLLRDVEILDYASRQE